jgi:thiol-disulfide isomerase/thioredoxin
MQKQTAVALILLGLIVVGSAIIASQKTVQMPMPPKGSFADRAQIIAMGDLPDMAPTGTPATNGHMSSLPILADSMPEFVGITKWWNTPDGRPLTPEKLKGNVVLIDFWTYSCINCIRTYPFIKTMHEKYADKGLVIVGVHTPEFAFEAVPENVEAEIKKNGFMHPIALDPEYATWNAYNNRYWPAEYFFDRQGRLRRTHFGEGEYEESEAAIRDLLEEAPQVDLGAAGDHLTTPDFSKIKTHETYFGLTRGDAFMGRVGAENVDVTYTVSTRVSDNTWTAGGIWRFTQEYVEARSADAVFRMSIQASKMHLVLESSDGKDKALAVFVDGIKVKDLTINRSTLYDIADFPDAARHIVEIRIKDAGVRFYAATFS